MKAGNYNYLGIENLEVELVAERTEIEPSNLTGLPAPHDTIDGRISSQMNFGTAHRQ